MSIEEGMAKGPTYAGEFETHVTVQILDPVALKRFEQTCAELEVQCVLIELARGVVRSQPMTSSHHRGTLLESYRGAVALANRLEQKGFFVSRIKIEAAPENLDIPQTDEQARLLPTGNYFEYHLKLILPVEARLEELQALCEARGAHLSANAFKRRDDDRSERFVTLRSYQVGRNSAESCLDVLERSLARAGHEVSTTICEYCVYDSNVGVDAQWLES